MEKERAEFSVGSRKVGLERERKKKNMLKAKEMEKKEKRNKCRGRGRHYINSERLERREMDPDPSLMGPPIMTIASPGYIKVNERERKKTKKKRGGKKGRTTKRENDMPSLHDAGRKQAKKMARLFSTVRKHRFASFEILIRPDELYFSSMSRWRRS